MSDLPSQAMVCVPAVAVGRLLSGCTASEPPAKCNTSCYSAVQEGETNGDVVLTGEEAGLAGVLRRGGPLDTVLLGPHHADRDAIHLCKVPPPPILFVGLPGLELCVVVHMNNHGGRCRSPR